MSIFWLSNYVYALFAVDCISVTIILLLAQCLAEWSNHDLTQMMLKLDL